MKLVIRCYAVILLLYSGWRSYDFIKNQLPEGEISMWLSILFLFATEAGLAIWHEASVNHSTTYTQHTTAIILTWVDFAASLGAGTADMILRQTLMEGYQIPALLASALIFGIPLIVAANVAGALVFLANDAESKLEQARRFLLFEASRQALKSIAENREVLVSGKRDEIYGDVARIVATPSGKSKKAIQPAVTINDTEIAGNGNGNRNF